MASSYNRREFLGLGALATAGIIAGCSGNEKRRSMDPYVFLDKAVDGKELKAGLIGCGGRGTGASINFIDAGTGLSIHSLGDVFQDRIDGCRRKLKEERNVEIADENCFVGFDAFEKVIDSGVDVIILATPPYFRPEHFAAAVNAKKHVFMEKPVAVDPVGARSVIASSKKAEALGLVVGTGTQRRHQRNYLDAWREVYNGKIGDIVGANVYWNQSELWYKTPQRGWTEMEAMIRDWVNWSWLSGDHIVEQHVHNLDVAFWFSENFPSRAVGFGSRHRRKTGDQYDNFSIDYEFDDGMHVHSMCRQINGCENNISEFLMGTNGYVNFGETTSIFDLKGQEIWKFNYPVDEKGEILWDQMMSPYLQEHIDLVTAIRTNKPFVEAENTAKSTLAAIMGRMSAYTGKAVTWDEAINSDLKVGPEKMAFGKVDIDKTVPIPGNE